MRATTHLRAPFPRSRRAFGTKPLTPDDFDKSHPLLDGCVGAFYFMEGAGTPVNLIDGIHASYIGTDNTWVASARGGAMGFAGTNSSDRIDLGSQPQGAPFNFGNENECTIITRFQFGSFGTTFPRIIDKSSGGSGQNGWALALRNAAPDRYVFYVAGGTTEVTGSNLTAGDVRGLAVSVKGGSTARFFENGAFLASNTVANNFVTTTTDAAIGNWNASTDRQFVGQMDYMLLFNRALPDNHVVALMRDPYAPFERPIVFPLAPAGDILRAATITGAGTIAATGKREVPRSATITGTGSVAATGSLAAELRAATISGVGTVAATGKREVPRSATITGTGSVTAVGDTAEVRTATISGVGTVAASRTVERPRTATAAGVGTVAATGVQEHVRAVAIAGAGSVAATGSIPGAAPPVDNSDPPITGGGRVMSQGSFPQWWENWEEPQPAEAPPPISPSFAELIAEAAAELPVPSTPPTAPRPVMRRRRSRMRATPAVRASTTVKRFTIGEAAERMARRQRRQTALLLLMRLLD